MQIVIMCTVYTFYIFRVKMLIHTSFFNSFQYGYRNLWGIFMLDQRALRDHFVLFSLFEFIYLFIKEKRITCSRCPYINVYNISISEFYVRFIFFAGFFGQKLYAKSVRFGLRLGVRFSVTLKHLSNNNVDGIEMTQKLREFLSFLFFVCAANRKKTPFCMHL